MLPQNFMGTDKTVPARESIKFVSAAYQMKEIDRVVYNTSGAAVTITLPSVASVAGHIVTIVKASAAAVNTTVSDAGDSGLADFTLGTQWDAAVLFSDGIRWHALLRQ